MSLEEFSVHGDFQRDIEIIVYSNAFRRMANKSQIIIKPIRDHFRSRLIHTEEVNQIALVLVRKLGLNTSLISASVYGHDIGHTPFGHVGERTLRDIIKRELQSSFGITRLIE